MQKTTNRILVVLTSNRDLRRSSTTPDMPEREEHHQQFDNNNACSAPNSTGFDIKEAAYIYHYLVKNSPSHQNTRPTVDFASTKGREAPIDPMSVKASERDDIVREFMRDQEALRYIKETKKLSEITPSDYQAVLFVGGAGAMFDLPNEHRISDIVCEVISKNQGIVATIGHGIAALLNVRDPKQPHQCLLKGKRVTCNTIEEEREMELDKALPFMLEKKLKEIGAKFEKHDKFQSNVVVDERIITGQNRNSAKEWVETIAQNLHKM